MLVLVCVHTAVESGGDMQEEWGNDQGAGGENQEQSGTEVWEQTGSNRGHGTETEGTCESLLPTLHPKSQQLVNNSTFTFLFNGYSQWIEQNSQTRTEQSRVSWSSHGFYILPYSFVHFIKVHSLR